MCSTLFNNHHFSYREFYFTLLRRYFRRRLLQICCMWERDNCPEETYKTEFSAFLFIKNNIMEIGSLCNKAHYGNGNVTIPLSIHQL